MLFSLSEARILNGERTSSFGSSQQVQLGCDWLCKLYTRMPEGFSFVGAKRSWGDFVGLEIFLNDSTPKTSNSMKTPSAERNYWYYGSLQTCSTCKCVFLRPWWHWKSYAVTFSWEKGWPFSSLLQKKDIIDRHSPVHKVYRRVAIP